MFDGLVGIVGDRIFGGDSFMLARCKKVACKGVILLIVYLKLAPRVELVQRCVKHLNYFVVSKFDSMIRVETCWDGVVLLFLLYELLFLFTHSMPIFQIYENFIKSELIVGG